jgi:hypothetical protein
MNDIPSFEDFKIRLLNSNSDGDLNLTYNRLSHYINNISDSQGNPLTYEFIMSKFEAFMNKWKYYYQKQIDQGFTSKDAMHTKKSLYEFLGETMYEQEFIIQKGSIERDRYLFGPFSVVYLKHQLKIFKEIFNRKDR